MLRRYSLLIGALSAAIAVCLGLLAFGISYADSGRFSFLVWNIFLAALPLIFAVLLLRMLQTKAWSSWPAISLSVIWLLFLPNSFYMVSDFIHLREVSESNILYNVVLFSAFIYVGMFMGFYSLYLVHQQLRRRIKRSAALLWVTAILLISAIAIYLGRDLRWNSWDVIVHPFGLLFDVSDRLLRPEDFPNMIVTIISFFGLLASLYAVTWAAARTLRR